MSAFVLLLNAALLAAAPMAAARDESTARPTPVVLVVLDGLPRSSLLDAAGNVDATWYPNLAAFAARSTRFTATTTVAVRTRDALPAILTGRMPDETKRLAIVDDHPDSLFSLLGDDYVTNAVETESILRDDGRGRLARERRLRAMQSDRNTDLDEQRTFRSFVEAVGPTVVRADRKGQGSLHFLHIRLPRFPWHHAASGTSYRPYRMYGILSDVWGDEPWWPEEAWRRHLLQLRFVDALMGELFAGLRKAGIDDEALVVLTAEYGTSFWPGESRRSLGASGHPEDVVHVPLLVKRPGQSEGSVSTRPAQAVDVLPTIADVLGREPDHAVDGCSLFDDSCPPLAERQVVQGDAHGRRSLAALPTDLTSRTTTLKRRLERIGSGDAPDKMYAFGPYSAIVGRSLASLDVVSAPPGEAPGTGVGHVEPDRQWARAGRGARGPRIAMELTLEDDPEGAPSVAIVRAGTVETVVPAPRTRRGRRLVVAMIPEREEVARADALSLFVVEGPPEAPRLRPLTIRKGRTPRRGG